jgi:hypothetical protein
VAAFVYYSSDDTAAARSKQQQAANRAEIHNDVGVVEVTASVLIYDDMFKHQYL